MLLGLNYQEQGTDAYVTLWEASDGEYQCAHRPQRKQWQVCSGVDDARGVDYWTFGVAQATIQHVLGEHGYQSQLGVELGVSAQDIGYGIGLGDEVVAALEL
jgi:hypothetical protein